MEKFKPIFCTLTFGAFCALATYSIGQYNAIQAYKSGQLVWYQAPVKNDDTKQDLGAR